MMHMSFWFGTDLNDFLFQGLNVSSTGGLVLLCFILIVSVWLQQGLRLALAYAKVSPRHAPCPDHTNLINTTFRRTPRWREMLKESSLYIIEVIAAYIIMLVVMTYNFWLMAAVIIGYGTAYGTLGQKMAALSHKPLIPCAHCIMASQTRYTSFGSNSSLAPSSTPVVSQVDLVPPAVTCCPKNTSSPKTTQASVHL